MMRKNIHVGSKADVIKRRAKELGFNVVEVKTPIRRIVTFNHPLVNQ